MGFCFRKWLNSFGIDFPTGIRIGGGVEHEPSGARKLLSFNDIAVPTSSGYADPQLLSEELIKIELRAIGRIVEDLVGLNKLIESGTSEGRAILGEMQRHGPEFGTNLGFAVVEAQVLFGVLRGIAFKMEPHLSVVDPVHGAREGFIPVMYGFRIWA